MGFVLQGVEPEGFPLLLQSLKTDGPVKDIHSNPNKKLYGGTVRLSVSCEHSARHLLHSLQFEARLTSLFSVLE